MKLLIKYPSRGRPAQFLRVLSDMVRLSNDKDNIHYLITADVNDGTMPKEIEREIKAITPNSKIIWGESKSKVHAINRDMEHSGEWDIVLLASDDMIPQIQGWDDIIRSNFKAHFPDTDGVLWFFDGHQHRICTLTIYGRKYYERFGYLYHPDYTSLWCDNEQTDVAVMLGKCKHFPDTILFKHEHPAWGGQVPMDTLYQRNEAYFQIDEAVYNKRKALNFPK